MHHHHRDGDPARDVNSALGLLDRVRAGIGVGAGQTQWPDPPAALVRGHHRCMDGVQRQSGRGQPLLQIRHCRGIVVVEMRSRREHLDRLEPMRRDLEQMITGKTLTVVEVCRDPELALGHP